MLELALPSRMIQRGNESNTNKVLAQEDNCCQHLRLLAESCLLSLEYYTFTYNDEVCAASSGLDCTRWHEVSIVPFTDIYPRLGKRLAKNNLMLL